MKRHIAIPLLCVVLVAALSIPVFSAFPYPENNVSGRALVRFWPSGATVPDPPEVFGGYQLNFGELWTGYFFTAVDYESYFVYTDISFTLEIYVGGSIFIAVPNNDYMGVDYSALNSYYDSSADYTVNFGNTSMKSYTPEVGGFVIGETTAPLDVKFLHFTSVPPGNYQISCESMYSDAGAMCFGVYVSQGDAYGAIVDQFVNGSMSYTETVDQLFQFQESLTPIDNHEAMVQALELQNNLTKLNNAASTVAAAKSNELDGKMESVINSFASGDVTMKYAMDTMQTDFSDALSGAQTVDEAQAVTAVYKANLKQLELQSQFQLMEGLDGVLSDEQIQNANDYYAAESELVNAFDLADLEAQFQYELWWNQMPKNETIEYKKFFDYLLNESDIRFFITIPLALSLVTIIMGTRMRTKPDSDSDSGSDVSHVWFSDGSAYHHNY